ncbi:MAG: GGDEF domain-containing protein [Desulfosoma sp.]|uniref:GGDEF domain-containing protein n=1 Tax=Desulfosoma sp. TaxID=2603217 RepID=UPI00404AEA24
MKILVADDDSTTRRMVASMLTKWGYEVVTAPSGDAAWNVLQGEDSPRLAVLDWVMPGMDGVDICRKVREEVPTDRYLYMILLTAKTSRQEIISGLEAGADDYMIKPFDPSELQVRVGIGRRIIALHEELVATREALRVQATRDALTGTYNRGAAYQRLVEEVDRAVREKQPLSLLMMDIDHFKKINDTYGHLVGDHVLKETVARVQSVIRSYDIVGRFGGEEFLVVLPHADTDFAIAVAERIRAAVSNRPILSGSVAVSVTLSAGVATARGPSVPDALIQSADEALYLAKRTGRNRVCVATERCAA